MKTSISHPRRLTAICLAISLAGPWAVAAAPPSAPNPETKTAPAGAVQAQNSISQAAASNAEGSQLDAAPSGPVQNPQAPGSSNTQPPAPAASQNSGQNPPPVGTAVAPYTPTVGIAASSPAGAAIAPAKQRRAHTFLIRMGLLIGAGVAVGTVVALSSGSSSRPH